MKKLKSYLIVLALAVFTFNSHAQQAQVTTKPLKRSSFSEIDQQKFLQVKSENDQPVSLQMANVRYVPKDNIPNDTYVDLISVVHIAEKSYYQQLNHLFKEYDAVLFELVAEDGSAIQNNNTNTSVNKSMLSSMQNMMKDVLGLSFQLDEIDYSKENFVHADISPQEFTASMDSKGESFFSMFLRVYLVSLQQQITNPSAMSNTDVFMALFSDDKTPMKRIAAEQFMNMDPVMNAIEGEEGSTIVTTRNLKALKVLREQLNKGHKKIAIFYGAAHMPEMARVLKEEFNMKKDSVTWMDAWDLR